MTSSTTSEARRRAVRQLLQDAAADGDGTAEATVAMFEKLCGHLVNLIGASGTSALLDRCVHEWGTAVGWGRAVSPQRPPWTEQLEQLHTALLRLEPPEALEAATTLMTAFASLLGTFLGEGLTAGMLHGLWPETFPERTVSDD